MHHPRLRDYVPLTSLDVLDSAVKIGLGALISGLSTWRITKSNHAHELDKLQLSRDNDNVAKRVAHRQAVFEGIATEVETFNHLALRYWALMTDWVRRRDKGTVISDRRKEEIDQAATDLWHAYKELTSAEAKLLLLGEKDAQGILRAYGERMGRLRAIAFVGSTDLTLQQLEEGRTAVMHLREQFFDVLCARHRETEEDAPRTLRAPAPKEALMPGTTPIG